MQPPLGWCLMEAAAVVGYDPCGAAWPSRFYPEAARFANDVIGLAVFLLDLRPTPQYPTSLFVAAQSRILPRPTGARGSSTK